MIEGPVKGLRSSPSPASKSPQSSSFEADVVDGFEGSEVVPKSLPKELSKPTAAEVEEEATVGVKGSLERPLSFEVVPSNGAHSCQSSFQYSVLVSSQNWIANSHRHCPSHQQNGKRLDLLRQIDHRSRKIAEVCCCRLRARNRHLRDRNDCPRANSRRPRRLRPNFRICRYDRLRLRWRGRERTERSQEGQCDL